MMGAVTYSNEEVRDYVGLRFAPVQLDIVEEPGWKERFNSNWTPTLIVEDVEGREHRRSQGYLDARRFLAEMSLAYLKDALNRGDFGTALSRKDEALAMTKGDSEREPEARYWAAVANYRGNEQPNDNLSGGWLPLMEAFPESDWAKKASVIRS